MQTKVCVDFINDDGACTTDDVLQALWQHCVDKEARSKSDCVKHWSFDADDWINLFGALKRLVQAGGWAMPVRAGGEP